MPASRRSGSAPKIGCAGWSLPTAQRRLFGSGDSMLARYATRFPVVEINSSFYRPHQHKTYRRWAQSVPAAFRFSVKLPRTITHDQRLQGGGPLLDRFVGEIDGLGRKLGGILVQLPPSLALDMRAASTFFRMLRRRYDGAVACEPRHASWFAPAVDGLWSRYRISRVAADPAPCAGADRIGGDPAWSYWRWHGSPRMYYSAYDDAALHALADDVRPAAGARWIIFDNTAHGHAGADAARLQEILSVVPPERH